MADELRNQARSAIERSARLTRKGTLMKTAHTVVLDGTDLQYGAIKTYASFTVAPGIFTTAGEMTSWSVVGPDEKSVNAEIKSQRATLKSIGGSMRRVIFSTGTNRIVVSDYRVERGFDTLEDRRA